MSTYLVHNIMRLIRAYQGVRDFPKAFAETLRSDKKTAKWVFVWQNAKENALFSVKML